MSFAKVVLTGTLTSEPEKRFTPNNHAVSSFNIQVENPGGGNRPGNNEPYLVKITCWRGLAEAVTTQLAKGDVVLVEGKLIMNSFQTPEGVQKKLFEIEANTIDKLPGAPQTVQAAPTEAASGGYSAGARNEAPAYAASSHNASQAGAGEPSPSSHFSSEDLLTEDDIPF